MPIRGLVSPQIFSASQLSAAASVYLAEPCARRLFAFFQDKGLAALKDEDRREQWCEDWIAYQAAHRLYSQLLSPTPGSSQAGGFDLLRYARFIELIAYFSPAHGYSLQVTFLGLFPILMGDNASLKSEALESLDNGGLFALGVSEKHHGSDLLGNEFRVSHNGDTCLHANGAKHYIGNANSADIISILARVEDSRSAGRRNRMRPILFVLRPAEAPGYRKPRKIRTLGIRAAFVGSFEVQDHPVPPADFIAEGRSAWEAVLGTVTLGKFFLGFGSVGICEHAFAEAAAHLTQRILYGKPVIAMPHIRSLIAQAFARLCAMKLYVYRALDYVHAASAADQRYLLFCAVQKAKVSVEGTKVMALLSECIGAKGFEADTYFEMALRDAQLIPGLEGSTHINLGLTAQFIARYFTQPVADLATPEPIDAMPNGARENPWLIEAPSASIPTIGFPHFQKSYEPLMDVPNVRLFVRQIEGFARFLTGNRLQRALASGTEITLALGQCQATIAYAQLIAENCVRVGIAREMVSLIFHSLVSDMSVSALALASSPLQGAEDKAALSPMIVHAQTTTEEYEFVVESAIASLAQ